jgi:spore maturation protein CgeB
MKVVLFCHSLLSDWNHGNAHFLRGIAMELMLRGHAVFAYEPRNSWSLANLVREHGHGPIAGFHGAYPGLFSRRYDLDHLDLDRVLHGADLVLAHEWNEPELVRRLGEHRARHGGYRLLFHDTHHRAVSAPRAMAAYDLRHYDGVLAFGRALCEVYRAQGWASQVWEWQEAADVRVFRPQLDDGPLAAGTAPEGDLVWIGNWGDEERTAELHEFLIEPVKRLGLKAMVYGVRYPAEGLAALARAGIEYGGWLPNYLVPRVYANFRVTLHIPRRPYVRALPGIPTIRPFEAMACGIPLVSALWDDPEGLFGPEEPMVVARDGAEMARCLASLLSDEARAQGLASRALRGVRRRHTCAHRVDDLLRLWRSLQAGPTRQAAMAA